MEVVNINISYFLEQHGWSKCWLYANHDLYEIVISHSFNDPIFECIDALISMMKGAKNSSFKWHGEPGCDRIILNEISTLQHCVWLKVVELNEDYLAHSDDLDLTEEKVAIEFQIPKIQLVRMFYYEFKKISELMKDKYFALNRKYEFPFTQFLEFEAIALKYIN